MTRDTAVRALAALAHPLRLDAFRALVVAGPEGLTPGVLQAQLGIPATTLSFHLKELAGAALVGVQRDGRHLIYRAAYPHMNALVAYLTQHCCEGAACELVSTSSPCDC
ncbi:MAG: helix-turn-helix transcriptional regulator [Hydrogenophaga sp.]|uniref:ArsR/SmtB family transcription factor n=1 Tax=Hydrogenophaga sp. TaxID=1904254 RepID=UPI001D4AE8FA|nr:metalloregulator ArsR/SmtB family transcription factor [Hydrogenophaga sp.]MBX3609037.1 helix-turn-helix transcriptional regulator [Hydrogenophaga sp.]